MIEELRIDKSDELANNLDIRLTQGSKKYILNIAEWITNEKNLKLKLVDLSLKTKRIAYYFELSFGIISFSSYVNIERMNIIFSDVELNKILANNPNKFLLPFKQLALKIC